MPKSWAVLVSVLVVVLQSQHIQSGYLRMIRMLDGRAMVLQLHEVQLHEEKEKEEDVNNSSPRWLKAMCCCWLRSHASNPNSRMWKHLFRLGMLHMEHKRQHAIFSLLYATHVLVSCSKVCASCADFYMY